MGPDSVNLILRHRSDLFRGLSRRSCSFTERCGMRHVTGKNAQTECSQILEVGYGRQLPAPTREDR